MYYHNSPTIKNIKMIKESRAGDMAEAINNMKQISASYKTILDDLAKLREKELRADELLRNYPDKAADVHKRMRHNYKIMDNKIAKFLSVVG